MATQTLTPRGDWDRTTIYNPLDLVSHLGSSYIAINSNIGTEPSFFSTAWMVLAEKGETTELNLRGPWQRSVIYSRFDVVSYQGSSWVARKESVGRRPAEDQFWMLLAERGPSIGAMGPPGPAGSVGPAGPQGPPGPGGGGGDVSIDEDGVEVVAAASTLDFDIGFDVAESPAGTARISLDASEVSGLPTTSNPGDAQQVGTDQDFANQLHRHAREPYAGAEIADIAATESAGVSNSVPRGDHRHAHGSGYAGGHTDSSMQNLYVQETDPGLTIPGLWIELRPDGTPRTFWVENGLP